MRSKARASPPETDMCEPMNRSGKTGKNGTCTPSVACRGMGRDLVENKIMAKIRN
jgi:hypothetical protein